MLHPGLSSATLFGHPGAPCPVSTGARPEVADEAPKLWMPLFGRSQATKWAFLEREDMTNVVAPTQRGIEPEPTKAREGGSYQDQERFKQGSKLRPPS